MGEISRVVGGDILEEALTMLSAEGQITAHQQARNQEADSKIGRSMTRPRRYDAQRSAMS